MLPFMVRFEHGFIAELDLFEITSPDIRGFYITAKTRKDAEREALAMLALIRTQQDSPEERLASVTFAAA